MMSPWIASIERTASTSAPARSRFATMRRSSSRLCEIARTRRLDKGTPQRPDILSESDATAKLRPEQNHDNHRSMPKPRLLVVDDEPDMLDFVERVMRRKYDVVRSSNADDA